MKTKVISAFPGTGKSYYAKAMHADLSNYIYDLNKWAIDSDSSKFDKTEFPDNYISHIKGKIGDTNIIFVSSHKEVREVLSENNINYFLIYPDISLKEEYLKRYQQRNNSNEFIGLLYNNWERWIYDCMQQAGCLHFVLNSNEYISDILDSNNFYRAASEYHNNIKGA